MTEKVPYDEEHETHSAASLFTKLSAAFNGSILISPTHLAATVTAFKLLSHSYMHLYLLARDKQF